MEVSFAAFLSSTPTIKELTEHVNVSTKWYLVGTMLDLDQKRLKSIEAQTGHNDAHKTVEMFNIWLETTPTASRRQVLEAMRADAVGENTLAQKYEKHLRELHQETYAPPSTKAVFILQKNIQSLNEALVSPVQVSQLLYCKRCISEATLDEMERIDQRRSLDDKKTTLLTVMQEIVSSDYRKLKDIATVLSDVEETRDIANKIMTEYEEKIPQDDDSTVVQPQVGVVSNEDRASDILRNSYSALSQSITEPVRMAKWLHEEVVISDEALSCVMSTRGSVSDSRAVLLKAVRDAVHSNYKHLELFVTVLQKDLKESQCINVQKEEMIDELKKKISSLEEEKTTDKESIIRDIEDEVDIFTDESSNTDDSSDTDRSDVSLDSDTPIKVGEKIEAVRSQYSMRLSNPSLDQCEKVISKLKDTDKSVILSHSSSDSMKFLIPTILEKGTINKLCIYFSLLTRGDIFSFSSQLSTNKSLTTLVLTTGSISDDGVIELAESLQHNKQLKNLHLNGNPGITSDSAHSLTELLLTNKKLQYLRLHHTSIDTDGVLILMESLMINNTLEQLWLDKEHEEICLTLPYLMATQHQEISFNAFLSSTPTIKELTEHVNVSTNWYTLGTMLDLDQRQLQDINGKAIPSTQKMIEMFNLWLTTTPTASRREVLEALRKSVVEENALAYEYEKHLRELHETTYVPPSTEAVFILQRNIQSLNEALVSPVQVSQLLYCKRCISEDTLDEMERIDQRRSLDDKKTTLLTAMQETVSHDYRKLKDIATVLSDVEETRDIGNEIMTKYEEEIPQDDDSTVVQPQVGVVISNEDRASDILRNNYSALSQSITEPVRMAMLLYKEVISDEALSCVMSTRGSVSDSRAVLLKAVRDAVHSNYKHLELFVTVLRKFPETAHIGDTIFEEYRKHFNYDDDVPEKEKFLAERNRDFQQRSMSTSSESLTFDHKEMDKHGDHEILLDRDVKKKFKEINLKSGTTFYRVRRIFNNKKNILDINEVKQLISDWFPDLKPQLSDKMTIGEVLDVLRRKCNIMDISPLENLAFEFNIEDAIPIIESFKEEAKDFCKSVSVSLCLGEKLQAVATPSRLLCETVVFVFNWNPDECTLQDINDVFDELEPLNRFKYILQVDEIDRNRSVVVTCYCPAEYTGSLIITVLGKIDTLQRRGLKEFILGNCTLWNTTQILSKNTEGADLLTEVNDLKAALRERDERIMVQEDGEVEWDWYDVTLTRPSVGQCKEVISKLENNHNTITFNYLSSDRIQSLIPIILGIHAIEQLHLLSSFFLRECILSFSSQLTTNGSLKTLALTGNSISDDGVIALAKSLEYNKTLECLHLNDNPGITSVSAESLAELLRNNNTLINLYLDKTNIDTSGVLKLIESLKTNNTLRELWLDKHHEKTCFTLPYYEDIENILIFEVKT
uniref:Death domain-containing protein n=1 Tax=Amphimedon queenslandica TaxID=400682 RepID=A0A1X7UH41_AMPQE